MRYHQLAESAVKQTFYHGSTTPIKTLTLDYVSIKGRVDQEGPGIYLTSSIDDARRYGDYVHVVEAVITKSRLAPEKKAFPPASITAMVKMSPNLEDVLMDWAEKPAVALAKMTSSIYDSLGPSSYRKMLEQVWWEAYRGYEKDYLEMVVKMGWDGFILDRAEDVKHFICFNPSILRITGMV